MRPVKQFDREKPISSEDPAWLRARSLKWLTECRRIKKGVEGLETAVVGQPYDGTAVQNLGPMATQIVIFSRRVKRLEKHLAEDRRRHLVSMQAYDTRAAELTAVRQLLTMLDEGVNELKSEAAAARRDEHASVKRQELRKQTQLDETNAVLSTHTTQNAFGMTFYRRMAPAGPCSSKAAAKKQQKRMRHVDRMLKGPTEPGSPGEGGIDAWLDPEGDDPCMSTFPATQLFRKVREAPLRPCNTH
jgi:hypothetical protein